MSDFVLYGSFFDHLDFLPQDVVEDWGPGGDFHSFDCCDFVSDFVLSGWSFDQ